jgi:hypothetical protein
MIFNNDKYFVKQGEFCNFCVDDSWNLKSAMTIVPTNGFDWGEKVAPDGIHHIAGYRSLFLAFRISAWAGVQTAVFLCHCSQADIWLTHTPCTACILMKFIPL